MSAKIFSLTILIFLTSFAFAQENPLQLTEDIGNIIDKQSKRVEPDKLPAIIHASLSKKYTLKKMTSGLKSLMSELIIQRRKIQVEENYISAKNLLVDHAMALSISAASPDQEYDRDKSSCENCQEILEVIFKDLPEHIIRLVTCITADNNYLHRYLSYERINQAYYSKPRPELRPWISVPPSATQRCKTIVNNLNAWYDWLHETVECIEIKCKEK